MNIESLKVSIHLTNQNQLQKSLIEKMILIKHRNIMFPENVINYLLYFHKRCWCHLFKKTNLCDNCFTQCALRMPTVLLRLLNISWFFITNEIPKDFSQIIKGSPAVLYGRWLLSKHGPHHSNILCFDTDFQYLPTSDHTLPIHFINKTLWKSIDPLRLCC